ncbi:MAG: hypothetical protein JST79_21765 [Acidobacteria bacterium]|nr:hypothetical protein [Acidobacteriota bacterium]
MEFTRHDLPLFESVQQLEELSAAAGLSEAQVMELLDCGLDIPQLMQHIHAMLHNRMN